MQLDFIILCCFIYFKDVDECDLKLCSNNGFCVNIFGLFYCNCVDSWDGLLCEYGRLYLLI